MLLKPDFNLESIYDICTKTLLERGIKGIFFDLDSTLMKSKSGAFTEKTSSFLEALSQNFQVAIITNNKDKAYIEKVSKACKCLPCAVLVFCDAKKPDTKVLNDMFKSFALAPEECALVGDRPLTDILAGKRAKMLTILVDSISKDEERAIVRFVRKCERLTIKS
ncbi:HAD superfamily (Subfamily IIIA) phosphatase [Candidatus Gastranaerophilus sp. (ex Termes propinquus)]|nr:HAD superfamily (Subfamily IIIA) phosphatase [Candidatus Gastranaerophilus sp. (ex Termes propinquus)]